MDIGLKEIPLHFYFENLCNFTVLTWNKPVNIYNVLDVSVIIISSMDATNPDIQRRKDETLLKAGTERINYFQSNISRTILSFTTISNTLLHYCIFNLKRKNGFFVSFSFTDAFIKKNKKE